MHGDNLFQSPDGREHLSPRTVPKKNPRTDPFYSPGGHNDSAETSPYTSVLLSPDEMMQSNSRNVQFDRVDWAASQKQKPTTQKRHITPTEDFKGGETINLTPPEKFQMQMPQMPPMPKPTHYSPPRILTRQQSPIDKSGLGIQMFDKEKALNEKREWEPTQPPPSHYVPYKEFQDVELNKAGYATSQHSLPPYRQEPNVHQANVYYNDYSSRRVPAWLWIVYILIFLTFFVGIPLAIFGGVYKWNYGKYRCSRSWGHWHEDTSSCTY